MKMFYQIKFKPVVIATQHNTTRHSREQEVSYNNQFTSNHKVTLVERNLLLNSLFSLCITGKSRKL